MRCHAHHALGPAASLRGRVSHPCLDEGLCFEAVEGGVECSDGAAAAGDVLDLLADGSAVSVFAQARGGGEEQVFKLAEHDYYYIVILIGRAVKTGLFSPVRSKILICPAPSRIGRGLSVMLELSERQPPCDWKGLEPTDAAKSIFERYVSGELTIEQMGAEIRALNAREFGAVHVSRD